MPIDKAILDAVVCNLPSPIIAQKSKLRHLCSNITDPTILNAFANCDSSPTAPILAYITKMYPVDLNQYTPSGIIKSKEFIAFGRLFSGILKKGSSIYVIGPKHGINGNNDIHNIKVS